MFKFIKRLISLIILLVIVFVGINIYVVYIGYTEIGAITENSDSSITAEELEELKSIDPQAILVLGAGLNGYGEPSTVLQDRLDFAIYLYEQGVADKILLSGDNGSISYNEVAAMKTYVSNAGVPDEDIFLDYAGFSTYESIYRAKEVFQVERMIIVTQQYHIYRADYIAEKLGIESLGAASNQNSSSLDVEQEVREALARVKDFFYCIFDIQPTYLGSPYPIEGDGTSTHV